MTKIIGLHYFLLILLIVAFLHQRLYNIKNILQFFLRIPVVVKFRMSPFLCAKVFFNFCENLHKFIDLALVHHPTGRWDFF